MAAIVDIGDEGIAESATKQVFSSYICRTITDRGMPHPGDVAEASSLAAVPLPHSRYPLWDSLPSDLVSSGKLSTLQLEGILYACTKHCEILPSGERAGFFIGDGAGVGKGRQITGVIIDNFVRGRKRSLWLSTSSDLHADATRDLRDLGCYLNVINNVTALDRESHTLGLAREYREGVLFMTYTTLISQSKGRSRLQQVVDWLVYGAGTNAGSMKSEGGAAATAVASALSSWDGLIVLDECHKAKNFVPGKEAASTKVASAVIALQERLPNARVLYCSATGVSEVGNMAYMVRMGLWGLGTAFSDFQTFLDSMRRRGVSFMEMLAMEMKAEGKYVARGLSFREAEFTEVEAPLHEQQMRMYDNAVQMWSRLKTQLEAALEVTGGGRDVWKGFWSTQQRFFKLLCVSLKVPTVVSEAREALAAGQCVVIGLQTTGEAAADAVGLEPGPAPGFVSPTKEMLLRFVAQHFPVRSAAAPAAGETASTAAAVAASGGAYGLVAAAPYVVGSYKELVPPPGSSRDGGPGPGPGPCGGNGEEIPECVSVREELLAAIDSLQLPANFLDEIIDQLGGPGKVAEMTGRKGRVVRVAGSGSQPGFRPRLVYELRAKPDSCEMDSLNIAEKDAFLQGSKLVAIISDAASTGISLHASRTAVNQRRRRHLTIELPWSADKAIQQLGRSHRSNQVSAPLYKLLSTRIGGEKRFAAAVARRLQSLGALTRGDRRAASGVDLSDKNFDTPIGRKSLRRMYDHIMSPTPVLPQGVTLADVFREHPSLARMLTPGASSSSVAPAVDAGANKRQGFGSGSGSGSVALFDFDDPAIVALHVAALHESCRRSCEVMGLDLPAPKPHGSVAAGGRGDAATDDAGSGSKDSGDGRGSGGDVRRFLNRLLGLRVEAQGLLFAYYAAVLGAEIQKARAEGKYSEGLADVAGTRIRLQSRAQLWVDPMSGLVTTNTTFRVDRGLSWEAAKRRLEREHLPGDSSGFRMSRRPLGYSHLVLLALQKPGARNLFSIARPNTGAAYFDMDRSDLEAKYLPSPPPGSPAEAQLEGLWRGAYDAALSQCSHGPGCRLGPDCGVGRRVTTVNVLSGSVVRVWGVLEAVLSRREMELPKMERMLRVVRVEWDQNNGDDDDGDDGVGTRSSCDEGDAGQQLRRNGNDGDDATEPQPLGSLQVTLSCSTVSSTGTATIACTDDTAAMGPKAGTADEKPERERASGRSNTAAATTAATAGGRSNVGGSGGSGGQRRRLRSTTDDKEGPDGVSSPSSEHHVVGVRYPAALLGEVVLALTSSTTATISNQTTLVQIPGGALALKTQQQQAPAAAATTAAAAISSCGPTPVDPRARAQAFRPPRTLMDFFQKHELGLCRSQGGDREASSRTTSGCVLQLPLGPRALPVLGADSTIVAALPAIATPANRSVACVAPVAVVKGERKLTVGPASTANARSLQLIVEPVPHKQRARRLCSVVHGGSGGNVSRGPAAPPGAPPAKRQRMVAALPAVRGDVTKKQQPQQQILGGRSGRWGAGGGGSIMAALARSQQLHAQQQQQPQQRRQPGTTGNVADADDVIDVVSIDCIERITCSGEAPATALDAPAPSSEVIMVESSDYDDEGKGPCGAARARDDTRNGGEINTTDAKGIGNEAAAGVKGSGEVGESGGEVSDTTGDGACDVHSDGDEVENDGGADKKFVLKDDEVGEDRDNWQPTRKRGGGSATGSAGHGSGHAGGTMTKRVSEVGRQAHCSISVHGAYSGGRDSGSVAASSGMAATLQGMGFSARQAGKALWMARGDFARAVELCLQGV